MKQTLLEIVQDILNDIDSDSVNSIDDTIESQQVAQIVKSTFLEMVANRNWPQHREVLQLESSGTTAKPTHMRLPDNLKEVVELRYDKARSTDTTKLYQRVDYIYPDEFLTYTNTRRTDNSSVQVVIDTDGVELMILNDQAPRYYTSFNDEDVIFDAYDSGVDDTLKNAKTQLIAYITPEWVHSDSAIPDLPVDAFPALVAEAKSFAFINLKQMVNEKTEASARRQSRWLSRKAWRTNGGIRYPNYGRQGKK